MAQATQAVGGAEAPRGLKSTLLIKELLKEGDAAFFPALRKATRSIATFEEALPLSTLRRKGLRAGLIPEQQTVRLAVLGGCTLHPLHELVEHFLACETPAGLKADLFLGDYDNYVSEIMEPSSALYEFAPEAVILVPSPRACRCDGTFLDSRETLESNARQTAAGLLDLCRILFERSRAEVVLANFAPPARYDPGPFRVRTLASEWNFRKLVNLEIGLGAPPFVHICDIEFLASRRGTLQSTDPRGWFESKQPWAFDLILDAARECAHIISGLRRSPKKVLVLDLDNTLWGGVIGDDGLEGIEIGDTSARGEAFKAFQQYVKSLTARGILLAVCSKNDREHAIEPFDKHPEMLLRMDDFAAFQANWEPKSDNIRRIAAELNLGLDSLVFVDDNPAELEIIRQFVPEVECLLLGPDPSDYVAQLQDGRYFEPRSITAEDLERVAQYKQEAERQQVMASFTDMDAYLASLGMTGVIREFRAIDVPRIAQLINKSNQFNLTTRRRSEAEVQALIADPAYVGFTMRLADRFGDHGLISIVIARISGAELEIDTWLMSCRVLKRQVEEEVLNEIVRLATLHNCSAVRGVYLPTKKNGMVRDHYPRFGFQPAAQSEGRYDYVLDAAVYRPVVTHIAILERSYE
jgi:FkbH-like protein